MTHDEGTSETTSGELLDRLHSMSRGLEYQPAVGRHGGRQLMGYRTRSDGRSELEWVIAAPGTRIAPMFAGHCPTVWRVQGHSTHQWESARLVEIVAAVPEQRNWVIDSHRAVLARLAERVGDRRSELLERLEDELRAVSPAPSEALRRGRPPFRSRQRNRRPGELKVTSTRPRSRGTAPLARAYSDPDLRVGDELDGPIIVCLSGTDAQSEAEIEVDLKRSVITFWPRHGQVAFDGEPLLGIRRLEVSRRSPEWDKSLSELIERLIVVN